MNMDTYTSKTLWETIKNAIPSALVYEAKYILGLELIEQSEDINIELESFATLMPISSSTKSPFKANGFIEFTPSVMHEINLFVAYLKDSSGINVPRNINIFDGKNKTNLSFEDSCKQQKFTLKPIINLLQEDLQLMKAHLQNMQLQIFSGISRNLVSGDSCASISDPQLFLRLRTPSDGGGDEDAYLSSEEDTYEYGTRSNRMRDVDLYELPATSRYSHCCERCSARSDSAEIAQTTRDFHQEISDFNLKDSAFDDEIDDDDDDDDDDLSLLDGPPVTHMLNNDEYLLSNSQSGTSFSDAWNNDSMDILPKPIGFKLVPPIGTRRLKHDHLSQHTKRSTSLKRRATPSSSRSTYSNEMDDLSCSKIASVNTSASTHGLVSAAHRFRRMVVDSRELTPNLNKINESPPAKRN